MTCETEEKPHEDSSFPRPRHQQIMLGLALIPVHGFQAVQWRDDDSHFPQLPWITLHTPLDEVHLHTSIREEENV
jgi:hypothetical protein